MTGEKGRAKQRCDRSMSSNLSTLRETRRTGPGRLIPVAYSNTPQGSSHFRYQMPRAPAPQDSSFRALGVECAKRHITVELFAVGDRYAHLATVGPCTSRRARLRIWAQTTEGPPSSLLYVLPTALMFSASKSTPRTIAHLCGSCSLPLGTRILCLPL